MADFRAILLSSLRGLISLSSTRGLLYPTGLLSALELDLDLDLGERPRMVLDILVLQTESLSLSTSNNSKADRGPNIISIGSLLSE